MNKAIRNEWFFSFLAETKLPLLIMQLQVKVDELKSADNVSLTSLNVFKLASKAVCEIFAFLSPDERQEASAQTYCGAGFKRNDLLYHCRYFCCSLAR